MALNSSSLGTWSQSSEDSHQSKLSKWQFNKSNIFQGIRVTAQHSSHFGEWITFTPLLPLPLPLCLLIAVFILSAWPRLRRPRAFAHMFSIVWIKVKWILGHYADWTCSTPLSYNVILNLCLLGHNCCVFSVVLCFGEQSEWINV